MARRREAASDELFKYKFMRVCCRRFGGNSGPFSSSAVDVVWSLSSAENLGVFDTQVKLALLQQGSLVSGDVESRWQPSTFQF